MKYAYNGQPIDEIARRSREGAWIEIIGVSQWEGNRAGRSREGAWIEIPLHRKAHNVLIVAPARERGLKFVQNKNISYGHLGHWSKFWGWAVT